MNPECCCDITGVEIDGGSGWNRTADRRLMSPSLHLKMLNKFSVTELAELSNLSKAYISQVKNGKRPPSQRLLESLGLTESKRVTLQKDYLALFLQSRQAIEVSPTTLKFYNSKLGKFMASIHPDGASQQQIEKFLLQFTNTGNRHTYYRALKTFYLWREQTFNLTNPMKLLKAPRLGKLILPSLSREQVQTLIEHAPTLRDKAIIALFTESGLRLSELAKIKATDIDWQSGTIQIIGKGRKEALAPFGALSSQYLTQWLAQYEPTDNIWGFNESGVVSMLRRLEKVTGLTCNPHTFRRTFACLLRKAGVDTMTIKDLGRWESLEMVQRYTRSVNFQDNLKFYKAPLS
jgi:site-specific recombinase XerD